MLGWNRKDKAAGRAQAAAEKLAGVKRGLDALAADADFGVAGTEEDTILRQAVQAFISRGEDLLSEVTPFLWQYYLGEYELLEAEDRVGWHVPALEPSVDDIWAEVRFRDPPAVNLGGGPLEPSRCYLSFEAEVSWEPEHGLQLVFDADARVCKVGPYDGHNTNAHAYGDASLLGVIFAQNVVSVERSPGEPASTARNPAQSALALVHLYSEDREHALCRQIFDGQNPLVLATDEGLAMMSLSGPTCPHCLRLRGETPRPA